MKYLALIVLPLSLLAQSAWAAPASEVSIKKLLAVTNASQLVENQQRQIMTQINNPIRMAFQGKQPNPAQMKAVENMNNKVIALLKKELTWAKAEPIAVKAYQKTLSQEEVDGMLAFYNTPSGQAMLKKMPQVVQETMGGMQGQLQPLGPQLQKIQQDFVTEMQAAGKTAAAPAPAK